MNAKKRDEKEGDENESKVSFLKKSALALILVIFLFVAFSATASAGVINVPRPGNETIQQAINNATAGDTILVNATAYNAQGTTETVVVNKSDIIIRSVNGTAVVSAGGASDHVFNITDQTNVTLKGFEIRDAHGTSQSVAGIYMYNASECNISNNAVTNISATGDYGACGILLYNSDNNAFNSNTSVSYVNATASGECARAYAFGIYLRSSSNNSFNSSTNISYVNATASGEDASADAYGIYLYSSSNNNSFNSNTSVSYVNATASGKDARPDAYGIYLYSSSNNNSFNSNTSVSYVNATASGECADADACGICLYSSSNNSFNSSTNISYVNATASGERAAAYAYGIKLGWSDNNSFSSGTNVSYVNATASDAGVDAYAFGILLYISDNNSFSSSTNISHVNASDDAYGIKLSSSDNNSFSSGSISDINAPTWWDFYSNENSHRNSAENITISSYPTTISFTYDNGVGIKSVETPPPDPALKSNIGKYVDATNVTVNSWLFLNVSYNASDVSGVQEDSLKMYRHNGTAWGEVPGSDVNTAENYVYANITDFSVFAPLGDHVTSITLPTATGTGNVTINTSSGYFCNETNALPASPPGPPALTFPHGFFNVTICGLDNTSAETVTINFTFPSAIPKNAEFWKYNSSNETWYRYPFDSNDGDNVISITITDNGAGDHNPALGVINDPNGVGWEAAAAAKVPALTPIGMIALVGLLSVIATMSISIRRKK